jgi:uncharacterized OB-fold protein
MLPGPDPTIDDKPFWDYCQAKELRFQRCSACDRFRAPPQPACPHCQSFDCSWVEAKDEAELFSYTVVHYKGHPAIAPALPYNVAVVLFPSFDNVRLISNVVGVGNDALRIGMKLQLVWEEAGNGIPLPRFTPAEARP